MNRITFYAYGSGTPTPTGKSSFGHMFFQITDGTILGWAPAEGGLSLKDDCSLANVEGTIKASFYVGDITLSAIQGLINRWLRDEKGYWPLVQDCVTFVKSIVAVINANLLAGQTPFPDTWSKFPKSVIESLAATSVDPAFQGHQIAA